MNAFSIVEQFEQRVAEFSGAKYGVAVNSCTNAIFLSMVLRIAQNKDYQDQIIRFPCRTFVSVPIQAIHAGFKHIEFANYDWRGQYEIRPLNIVDGALRFIKGMYDFGTLHCLSFHARKIIGIGNGGMILTNNEFEADWLRKARYSGKDKAKNYSNDEIETLGWQMYMPPSDAARGLHLMEYIGDGAPDQIVQYSDLRNVKLFQQYMKGDDTPPSKSTIRFGRSVDQ